VFDNVEVSSTSSYVSTLGEGVVLWKSAKQTYIAPSIMEAEFIALELAGQEVEWLKNLLVDMPLWWRQPTTVSPHCDSQTAIRVAYNSVYNVQKRQIHIRHSAVKQMLKHGVIYLEYVISERNLTDPLTKGLTR